MADEQPKTKLIEFRQRLAEVEEEMLIFSERETLTEEEEDRWRDLDNERKAIKPELEKLELRAKRAEEIRASVHRQSRGDTPFELATRDVNQMNWREARDGALRVLGDNDANWILSSPAGDLLDREIRKNPELARRILVTENEHYRSAWFKLVTDPTASAILSDEERAAVRAQYQFRNGEAERAGGQSTTVGAGGYAIPVKLAA